MQSIENLNERYLVVSIDGHVGPPIEEYREYCPEKYLSVFDEQVQTVRSRRDEDSGMLDFAELVKDFTGHVPDPKVVAAMDRVAGIEGAWDPAARLRDMDSSGIAGEVIFHGHENGEPMPLLGEGFLHPRSSWSHHEYDVPGCRIYNRWLTDFVSDSRGRQAGLAYVPITDVENAVKEVEWAYNAGLRGINFPAPRRDLPLFYDGSLDPLYDVCAQLGMPLNTHAGGGEGWDYGVGGSFVRAMRDVEASFNSRRGVWQLIFSGVFDRFPRLKVVLTELRSQWVPEMVRDLDAAYLDPLNPEARSLISKLPSDYWAENFYVGASFMSHDEALMYPERGTKSIMWGADYPHLEGTHPYTRLALQCTFHDIAHGAVADMLGLTAVEAYGFDEEMLRAVADSIGPTVSDLADWTGELPGPEYVGYAFRQNTNWPALSLA